MYDTITSITSADGLRIALVVSRYHQHITAALQAGAIDEFEQAGGNPADLIILPAPGAFEITVLCRNAVGLCDVDAVVALGCVITGETDHDKYICRSVVTGITEITLDTGMPIALGLLTCRTMEQAEARAGGNKGNKGAEAMTAAIEATGVIRQLLERAEQADDD